MAKQEFGPRHLRLKSAFLTSGAPRLTIHTPPRGNGNFSGVSGKDREQRDGTENVWRWLSL